MRVRTHPQQALVASPGRRRLSLAVAAPAPRRRPRRPDFTLSPPT